MSAASATIGVTVADVARSARGRLADAGIATPELDARILVAHAAGLNRASMIAEARTVLTEETIVAIDRLVARRAAGEPVGRILGRREFWGLDLRLGPDTLEPRPDSETIVEAALALIDSEFGRDAPLRIADLGTGTGCLLLALLSELPGARGTGVDISAGAVAVARENAAANGLAGRADFAVGSWTSALNPNRDEAGFDVIVANPPYIESDACRHLDREVADHDPLLALDGGPDGLDAYRAILADISGVLETRGALVLELGQGQSEVVTALAQAHGLVTVAAYRDLSGIERAVVMRQSHAGVANAEKTLGIPRRTR